MGRFLETAEFFGNLYGTPTPDPSPSQDIVLEINLDGAIQVREKYPDAVIILLLPPSPAEQAARLRSRGDDEDEVARRVALGLEEERIGRELTPYVVVNDDVDNAVSQVAAIIESHRKRSRA